uniref:Transposase IS200 like n=1 Tax=Candidatus Kentrum eta TaxID=2126337 RepID=A0A450VR86_9GAMM|nr:MAG: hypothetical protein BECKH772C_GA0070978_104084 [Candidatus Kentron sp. H]
MGLHLGFQSAFGNFLGQFIEQTTFPKDIFSRMTAGQQLVDWFVRYWYSSLLFAEFAECHLHKSFYTLGYAVSTVGFEEEQIRKYILNQEHMDRGDPNEGGRF